MGVKFYSLDFDPKSKLTYECVICQDQVKKGGIYHSGEGLKHPIHEKCMKTWATYKPYNPTCPSCNIPIDEYSLYLFHERPILYIRKDTLARAFLGSLFTATAITHRLSILRENSVIEADLLIITAATIVGFIGTKLDYSTKSKLVTAFGMSFIASFSLNYMVYGDKS